MENTKEETTMKVTNESGILIDFDAAVQMMDDDIREQLHAEGYQRQVHAGC